MKITDSEIIKTGEQELIDAITADLDWGAIEEIFMKDHHLGIEEDIEYKSGDIVAVDNQIAYKLEFTVKVNLSVLLNRDGEYLSVTVSNKEENLEENTQATETDTENDIYVEDSVPSNNDIEPIMEQDIDSSGNTDETGSAINDIADDEGNTSDESITVPFNDFSDSNTDDMGQKVDDIIENLKKTG